MDSTEESKQEWRWAVWQTPGNRNVKCSNRETTDDGSDSSAEKDQFQILTQYFNNSST